MRLHLEQIGGIAGHQIDYARVGDRAWIAASIRAFQGDERQLAQVIGKAIGMSRRALGQVREAHAKRYGG
jgi:hypothetical protein